MKNIRNFCIIAHIDHGKSTLADRLLEITHTVAKRDMKEQILDQMDLERERGITIKLQPVRMTYRLQTPSVKPQDPNKLQIQNSDSEFILNLIDTPGHVDFAYEVSRSLAACEGALLVVDATQGVQAQTLANVYLALEHDLTIIPVINKIDLPIARPEEVAAELEQIFGFKREEMVFVSAKTGQGIPALLEAVIARIPSPRGSESDNLRALIFDSVYDLHRGVVAYVRVVDGKISKNEDIRMIGSGEKVTAIDVGYFKPKLVSSPAINTGEVGFIVTGLRDVRGARVGDTVTRLKSQASPLPGYKEIQPMVYADMFPVSGEEYPELREAVEKLSLNDASLSFEPEHIPSLGHGFRMGFLGLLHMDIVQERLSREFNVDVIATAPSVAYKVIMRAGETIIAKSAADLPDPSAIASIEEPWAEMNIVTPETYVGGIMELITSRRGILGNVEYISAGRVNVHAKVPLASVIIDFYDRLKSISSGYASLNYEVREYKADDLVKIDILVGGEQVEALSTIVHRSEAEMVGRQITEKLKELIPKQQFEIPVQAAIGGKIIARETIKAFRKDVTGYLYGGDVTRKMKLLKKQKIGKKRMKQVGKISIPQEAFLAVLKK